MYTWILKATIFFVVDVICKQYLIEIRNAQYIWAESLSVINLRSVIAIETSSLKKRKIKSKQPNHASMKRAPPDLQSLRWIWLTITRKSHTLTPVFLTKCDEAWHKTYMMPFVVVVSVQFQLKWLLPFYALLTST